ncbi:MAG: hypothetical protein HY954_00430 [Deltaproteobacteria bacterium]|nr:hypothetical protein [Deltaproteobacteria bacterium]
MKGFLKTALMGLAAVLMIAGASFAASPLDRESEECISCHETVSDSQVCHSGDCGHAVPSDYALAASKNRGLVRPSALIPAIRLVDNRIACVTCHVEYSKTGHLILAGQRKQGAVPDPMLSVDNSQSKLCTSCHAK